MQLFFSPFSERELVVADSCSEQRCEQVNGARFVRNLPLNAAFKSYHINMINLILNGSKCL